MRKLFLLIPAFLLSVAVNAATTNVNPGTGTLSAAIGAASNGDILVLADGTYTETAYVAISKQLTIRAAENATPVVHQNTYRMTVNDEITIIGVTFESGHSNELLRIATTAADKTITIQNCTFRSAGYGVKVRESECQQLENIVIDNCVFENIAYHAIIAEAKATAPGITKAISISNSTFVACGKSGSHNPTIEIHDDDDNPATAGPVTLIDHCTFYNCSPSQYTIYLHKIGPQATISNCIVSNPAEEQATSAYYGYDNFNVTNCIWYKCTSGYRTPATSANITNSDPLFADAAHGDFSLAGDFINDNVSPARNAGTDGSDLGDPRWYTPATYPTTDFVGGYAFTAQKAKLSGNIVYETGGPSDPYLRYNHSYKTGNAEWIIQATKPCYISATVNMADNTWNYDSADPVNKYFQNHKHVFVVEVRKANNTLVGSVKEGDYNEDGSTDGWDTYPTVNLKGNIYIPEAGIYSVILKNYRNESRCGVANVTLAYAGGDVTDIAASGNTSLDVADAWFEGCTRGADRIVYPSSGTSSAWIKWNIAATETKFYDLTLNINAPNAHGFTAALYEDESASPVASVTEGSYVGTTGVLALELGRVNLVGGKNYVVKLTNAPSGSVAEVLDLTFAAVAASATELPGTLAFGNAVLSAKAHVTDGKLYFAPIGDTNPEGEWARWAVTTDHNGLFLFTMGVNSTNSQSYRISIYNDLDTRIDVYEAKPSSGAQTIKHYFNLATGNYSVQVENTTRWSRGYLTSLVVTEPAGVVTLNENATDNSAWASKVDDGNQYDVQIQRSFRGGMYNTFCLPFAVSESQLKDVFGSDVQVFTLGEATIEDQVLDLTINPASDIYQGTPVLIKPAADLANPIFIDVQFSVDAAGSTNKTNANFVGSFVKTNLTASEDLLYVGAYDKLYFLSVDYAMPGLRAWFEIHDLPSALHSPRALKGMRLSERGKMPTDIQPIETPNNARKVLRNGQLYILRDGVIYNMTGARVQ